MDDQEDICKLVQKFLSRHGYLVETANDGNMALDLFQEALLIKEEYDFVILDLKVPRGMGGYETLQNMKKIHPNVKAMVISGYSENNILVNYQQHGFIASLAKPFHLDELASVISSYFIKSECVET